MERLYKKRLTIKKNSKLLNNKKPIFRANSNHTNNNSNKIESINMEIIDELKEKAELIVKN